MSLMKELISRSLLDPEVQFFRAKKNERTQKEVSAVELHSLCLQVYYDYYYYHHDSYYCYD